VTSAHHEPATTHHSLITMTSFALLTRLRVGPKMSRGFSTTAHP